MRFILIGLLFYLLVSAYFAAQRVARKRQLAKDSFQGNSAQSPAQKAIEASLVEQSSQPDPSEMPIDEPIPEVASDVAVSVDEIPSGTDAPVRSAPEMPEPVSPVSAADRTTAENTAAKNTAPDQASPILPIGSPMLINPDLDIPLAVSLSVSDVVNPEQAGTVEVPDLIPTDPAISEVLHASAEPTPAHPPSILEEIAELRPTADVERTSTSDPVTHFMHALQTGDGTVRVAAVYELGEIAARRQGNTEQIIEQLQQLTQDEDPDVRLQAIAALAKVEG